jgi:hypothetical protein
MTKERNLSDKSTFYCNPDELKECVEEFNAARIVDPEAKMSTQYAEMLMQICHGLAYNPQFKSGINDLYRDEMISEAIYACVKAAPKCDTNRLNKHGDLVSPFAFFTTVARYAFYSVIESEKKLYYTHEKYYATTFPISGVAQWDDSTPVRQKFTDDDFDVNIDMVFEQFSEDGE